MLSPLLAWRAALPAASASGSVSTWTGLFSQSFYHASTVPLLVLTIALAWSTKSTTNENLPKGFAKLKFVYLSVWCICVAADWLQGPYVYALYAAYGYDRSQIARLFLVGHLSSLTFAFFVGTLADRFGRKKACMAYCAIYSLSCVIIHFNNFYLLLLGRTLGGMSTVILYSCFECWLVSEHLLEHRFAEELLSYLLGSMYFLMYLVAIGAGIVSQFIAELSTLHPISDGSILNIGGISTPFDLAIVCALIGAALIACSWNENYGVREDFKVPGILDSLRMVSHYTKKDIRTWLLAIVVACFEGSMFCFVFQWTPALESRHSPPPYGLIFALFMMACMCGASISSSTCGASTPIRRMNTLILVSTGAFVVASLTACKDRLLPICFASFMIFEFCVGMYYPIVGLLKSEIVPNKVRGTMYAMYRVPLNGLVACALMTSMSTVSFFALCAVMQFGALSASVCIDLRSRSTANEVEALLGQLGHKSIITRPL